MTLPRDYELLNQSFIIFSKCQYLEMVHSFTMVEKNGTGNAYKHMKTFKRYNTKTTGPFLIIFWGFNADTLIFNYWEIEQIKFTLKS